MSSIRPLVTISILGIVGFVLYMKINETEPVVPADAMNWDVGGDLQIGDLDTAATSDLGNIDIGGGDMLSQTTAAPPATTSAPAFNNAASSTAPAFNNQPAQTSTPENLSSAPAFAPAAKADAPPAFVPSTAPPAVTPKTDTISSAALTSKPAASTTNTSETSKLPPLPALPAVAGAVAGAAAIANELSDKPVSTPAAFTPDAPKTSSPQASMAPSFDAQAPTTHESLQAETQTTAGQASLFSATRLAVQSALDRGELSQALLLLSDWYGDPSLTADEAGEVQKLLSQLAGSVIYSTEHRLESPYMVLAGEKLTDIAEKYKVPWQLLAKINGIANPDQLQSGQQIKVIRGPFSARIDLSERKMVLMLDRRYAGQFAIEVDPTSSIEEGYWAVNQKLLTPGNIGTLNPAASSEDRSILLTSTGGSTSQVTILRGPGPATDPAGRVIQLKSNDVGDVYDILSLGSQVVIRR